MFVLSLIFLLLCFSFGYLALAQLLVLHRLRRQQFEARELFRRSGVIQLTSQYKSNLPISYL